jgi:hypothetical protein
MNDMHLLLSGFRQLPLRILPLHVSKWGLLFWKTSLRLWPGTTAAAWCCTARTFNAADGELLPDWGSDPVQSSMYLIG